MRQLSTRVDVDPAPDIRCRLAGPEDHPRVVEMWERHSGWGALIGTPWQEVIEQGPYGPSLVFMAEAASTGEHIAQLICHRSSVVLGDAVVPAARPFGAVVAGGQRASSLGGILRRGHPLHQLAAYTFERLPELGFPLVFWLPNPRFGRMLRAFPFLHQFRFPLYSRGFDSPPLVMPEGMRWERREWDLTLLSLCERGIPEPVHSRRTPESLAWYQRVLGQQVAGVYRGDELVAVGAGRHHGDRQWQIEDLLAVDDAARRAAIIAVVQLGEQLSGERSADDRFRKAALLVTPSLLAPVTSLGFERDAYDFLFAVGDLSGTLAAEPLTDPSSWYLSAGD